MVGGEPLPRGDVVSKVWDYIKKHDLQNPENRREILADDKLEEGFKVRVTSYIERTQFRRGAPRSARTAKAST